MPATTTIPPFLVPEFAFEGRKVLLGPELAVALRCTDRHVRNMLGGDTPGKLLDLGLGAVDIRAPRASQPCWRFPVSFVHGFLARRVVGLSRRAALDLLPTGDLRALEADVRDLIKRRTAAA